MKYDKIVEAFFIERPNRFIARSKNVSTIFFVSSISILLPSFGLRSGNLISPKPSFFSLVNTFSIKSPFSPFIIFIYFTPYLYSWQIFIYYHLKYLIAILLTVHPFHTSNNNCSKPLAMIE